MSESSSHILLVQSLVAWVAENFLGGDRGMILIDSPYTVASQKPPRIARFVPDVFVPSGFIGGMIIGEAKTDKDLERRHSLEQIDEFLLECSRYDGSLFVLAVPWYNTRLARAILREIQRRNAIQVNTIVIDKLPG